MLKIIQKASTQKELFFQLSSILSDSNLGQGKVHAVYAIYKDDICFYVGQSKNISSRLATHLYSKYKTSTKVKIFTSYEYEDGEWLLETEKYLIRELKPIENILVDNDQPININLLQEVLHDVALNAPALIDDAVGLTIIQDSSMLIAYSSELIPDLSSLNKSTIEHISTIINNKDI